MANDFPQIVDQSTLSGLFNTDQFLTIGVEGRKEADGSATIGLPVTIGSADAAKVAFGASASLTQLVTFILNRGVNYVVAVASKSASAPLLADRQAAWAALADDPTIRIRLTDSVTQADLVSLADSCEAAEAVQNKQFAVVGLASGTAKASLITAAGAVLSKRAVLVGPGVYVGGVLMSGAYGAALAAAEIAKNPDIVDSLNGFTIPGTNGIETEAATGLPLFRLRSNIAGSPTNDFQDLLTGGVSPFQTDPSGLAAFSHLRTTYTTDDTFDSLMTLLIIDQVFIGIREELRGQRFLRKGNTADTRAQAAAYVNAWLVEHDDWVEPVDLPDGTTGYGVTVTPSSDEKSFTVSYNGHVVRGTNVINIAGQLTIAV